MEDENKVGSSGSLLEGDQVLLKKPTSLSALSPAVALHPQSALLLQPPQFCLSLLQLPLQELQLFLSGEEKWSRQSGIPVTSFVAQTQMDRIR